MNKANWKDLLKFNWGILIIGLFFAFLGLWVSIQWYPYHPAAGLYFFNLLPGALLLLTWYSASTHPQRRWKYIGIGALLTLVITTLVIFMNLAGGAFLALTTPDTDIAEYYEISAKLDESEITRHFPHPIPENATNIKFELLPKFMQGGGHMQLRYNLIQFEIEELLLEYRSKAKYTFIGGDRSDHRNDGGIPTTYFYTNATDDFSFPDDYEILVLDAEPGGSPEFQWNHGYSYGVIISLERSEIIYWVEYW